MIDLRTRIFRREASADSEDRPKVDGAKFSEAIVRANNPQSALTLSAVYRAVNVLSDAIANITLEYQRKNALGGHYEAYQRFGGKNINYLLSVKPNGKTNKFQFFKQLVCQILLQGNAFVYPVGSMDEPTALILCSPWSVTYNRGNDTFNISDDFNNLYRSNVKRGDILHFPNIMVDDSGIGLSTIHYARLTLAESATIQAESLKRAATGGRFKAIISQEEKSDGFLPGTASLQEMEGTKDDLQEQVNNGNDLLLIRNGMKVTPFSMSTADMQFIDSRKLTIADIARFFNTPKVILMEDQNSKYNTPEQAMLELKNFGLQPLISGIESEFDCKMGSEDGKYRFRFNVERLYNVDQKAKSEYYKGMFELGVFCTNEIRAKEGLPPVELGDTHYISANVAQLGSEKLSGTATTQTQNNTQEGIA